MRQNDMLFGHQSITSMEKNNSDLLKLTRHTSNKRDSFKIFCDQKWEDTQLQHEVRFEENELLVKCDLFSNQDKASTMFEWVFNLSSLLHQFKYLKNLYGYFNLMCLSCFFAYILHKGLVNIK